MCVLAPEADRIKGLLGDNDGRRLGTSTAGSFWPWESISSVENRFCLNTDPILHVHRPAYKSFLVTRDSKHSRAYDFVNNLSFCGNLSPL